MGKHPAALLLLLSLVASRSAAQTVAPQNQAGTGSVTPDHAAHTQQMTMAPMTGPLGISMAREGSGTAWLPDSTPMYMAHQMAGSWMFMLHGNLFAQYVKEGSDRGDDQFGSVNWIMGMARRPLASGTFMLRAMLSAEPATVGRCGYPDLLATGELCRGEPLHDRQHPHDLFMELAASYERELSSKVAFQLYGGPVGEPAVGPVAYPHRISAMAAPLAPITHHWLDATHISFGVVTAALYGQKWKLEGSFFNGREPDEERYDLDLDTMDSYAARIWLVPGPNWALQTSFAEIKEAEFSPDEGERHDVSRTTASATYHRPLAGGGVWASTAAWGRNVEEGQATSAILVETVLNLRERNVFFARGELVGKTGHDLAVDTENSALADEVFTVSNISAGYVRQLGEIGGLVPGIGVRASASFVPSTLEPFYGERVPLGIAAFLSLRPKAMQADIHAMHRSR